MSKSRVKRKREKMRVRCRRLSCALEELESGPIFSLSKGLNSRQLSTTLVLVWCGRKEYTCIENGPIQ